MVPTTTAAKDPIVPVLMLTKSVKIGAGPEVLTNVTLAASKIDGLGVLPGERFSYNDAVGERTEARGFKIAKTLFEGAETKDLGGGVCQVSTALYVALMYGGYKVTERHPHSRPRDYVPPGMDSSVNWRDLDLKFVNDDTRPLIIHAAVKDGEVSISLETLKPAPNVTTRWVGYQPTPFETRRIESAVLKKVYRHREGLPGSPGFRVWSYDGGPGLSVPSVYKPIMEVLVVPAGT